MASYEGAMEAAGAVVHVFKDFGSYQGEWWAKVTYEGTTGWVSGSFGSCSGCDSLRAEFAYDDEPDEVFADWVRRNEWRGEPTWFTFLKYHEAREAFRERYAAFGRGYLDDIKTQEVAEKEASENLEWDRDATEMLDFLAAHRVAPEPAPAMAETTTCSTNAGLSRFGDLELEDI